MSQKNCRGQWRCDSTGHKYEIKARRKKEGEEKKIMAALLVFMLSSLKTEFKTKKLFDRRDLFWL